jgi:hypothetical protein
MKEVASFSQLNKTHVYQEKQSSTPTMVFRHAKNIQKTELFSCATLPKFWFSMQILLTSDPELSTVGL